MHLGFDIARNHSPCSIRESLESQRDRTKVQKSARNIILASASAKETHLDADFAN